MGAITPAGHLTLHVQDHAVKGPAVVRFLRHLLRRLPGKRLVVWDGAPIHRSQPVKDFLAAGGAQRIHLEQFPGYAPELNPAEGLWHYLKDVELTNAAGRDLAHLRSELRKATAWLRHKTCVIRGCVQQPGYV